MPPLGTPTFRVDVCRMGRPALHQSFLSVGSRVVCYHDVLLVATVLMYSVVCVEADMFVLVDLFKRLVECRAQTVGGIASTLGKTNACYATLGVGSVDSHTFLVAFVGFGQAGPFVLCEGNAFVKGTGCRYCAGAGVSAS